MDNRKGGYIKQDLIFIAAWFSCLLLSIIVMLSYREYRNFMDTNIVSTPNNADNRYLPINATITSKDVETRSKPYSKYKKRGEIINFRDNTFDTYLVDLDNSTIKFYHKNDSGKKIVSLENLRRFVERSDRDLLFATNAGMYTESNDPQGLWIENGVENVSIDLTNGNGTDNFYLKPNGVFVITNSQKAIIIKSPDFEKVRKKTMYATQSGPMLVINDTIHPIFKEGSPNKNIRSGVGIIDDSHIVFAISNETINFYDFAMMFKEYYGCQNALYLDGAISKMYLPEINRYDLDGNFGGMIAVTQSKN